MNRLLALMLDDDIFETVDALAGGSVRAIAPHIAQMTHAQELSDLTTLCECLHGVLAGGSAVEQALATYRQYVERRLGVGFTPEELQLVLMTCRAILTRRLNAYQHNSGGESTSNEEEIKAARVDLGDALRRLEGLLSSAEGQ